MASRGMYCSSSPAPMATRTPPVMSGAAWNQCDGSTIRPRTSAAFLNESARKNTHAKQTMWNVTSRWIRRRRLIQRLVTFHIVCLAWVFFRADSFKNAADVLGRIVDPSHWFHAAPLITGGVLVAIGAGLLEQYIPRDAMARAMAAFSRLSPVAQGVTLGFVLLITN